MRDVGVRPAGFVGHRLHPPRLVKAFAGGPVGLDVDRFDDIAAGRVAAVFGDRIVAADRLIGPEDARHLRPRKPGQIVQPPDVMVGVDGRKGLHLHSLNFIRNRYALAAGSEAGTSPKISAAIRLVSIAAGTPQYIATNNSTSCTCSLVHPFASAPLA